MSTDAAKLILLNEADNVLVAMGPIGPGVVTLPDGRSVEMPAQVTLGHKIAATAISEGALIVKYGMPIGVATQDIAAGAHVHVHNVASRYTATNYRVEDSGVAYE